MDTRLESRSERIWREENYPEGKWDTGEDSKRIAREGSDLNIIMIRMCEDAKVMSITVYADSKMKHTICILKTKKKFF